MSGSFNIQKISEVHYKVWGDPSIEAELSDYFQFRMPGYQFTPKYKAGIWDGFIRLYNLGRKTIYVGLYDYILKFAERNGYTIVKHGEEDLVTNNHIDFDILTRWVHALNLAARGKPVEIHKHQLDAVFHALNEDRVTLESPTSSGKSMIIYNIVRWHLERDRRILIIVPTTQLCEQLYSDFEDYSSLNGFPVSDYVQKLYSGFTKTISRHVLISTWQSLHKQQPSYYNQFDAVICDEVHLAKGASITGIMEKMHHTKYRVGLTGTLDDAKSNRLQICGLFGRQIKVISTRELMDMGKVAELSIKCLVLKHTEEDRQLIKGAAFKDEVQFVNTMQKRNEFIAKLAKATKGNTLILCTWVNKHILPLEKIMEKVVTDRSIYLIYGDIDPATRESIRKQLEHESDAIIIASFATCSTGINIPSIENIILAASSKSKIRNLQSIGRGLRLKEGKDKCMMFDIADDLSWKKKENHVLKHFKERVNQYAREQFEYKIVEVNI